MTLKPGVSPHAKVLTRASDIQYYRTGVGATLARDVPFSAVYWGMLEPIRKSLLPSDGSNATPTRTIAANMLAGGIGGAAASAITQPLVRSSTLMEGACLAVMGCF